MSALGLAQRILAVTTADQMYEINNRVREEFRRDPRYRTALENLTKMLESEKDLDIFCAHEAGHLTYFLKMGLLESELAFHGPTIYYNFEIADFIFYPCAVLKPKKPFQTEAGLKLIAQACVAGGVFEKELEGSSNLGDKADRQLFHSFYAVALIEGVIPTQTEQEMWERAQDEVRRELMGESNLTAARERAKQIKTRCFQLSA
jgi:hypothetical protein